jgi:hypothetical protein
LAFEVLIAEAYLASHVGDGTYVLGHAHRSRERLWLRRRHWIRDPDGLLLWITTADRSGGGWRL